MCLKKSKTAYISGRFNLNEENGTKFDYLSFISVDVLLFWFVSLINGACTEGDITFHFLTMQFCVHRLSNSGIPHVQPQPWLPTIMMTAACIVTNGSTHTPASGLRASRPSHTVVFHMY